jgi:hypothetical protein
MTGHEKGDLLIQMTALADLIVFSFPDIWAFYNGRR